MNSFCRLTRSGPSGRCCLEREFTEKVTRFSCQCCRIRPHIRLTDFQALVAWVLILHAMPAVGLGLLDLARDLAALDVPTRVIQFFAGAAQ